MVTEHELRQELQRHAARLRPGEAQSIAASWAPRLARVKPEDLAAFVAQGLAQRAEHGGNRAMTPPPRRFNYF